MCHLGGVLAQRHQSCLCEYVKHVAHILCPFGIGHQFVEGCPPPGILGAFTEFCQAKEDVSRNYLFLSRKILKYTLCRMSYGAAHAPCIGIAFKSERMTCAPLPRFEQSMGQQRQSTRLLANISQDKI